MIKAYVATGKNLDFIDLWDGILDAEGKPRAELFVADGVHNSPEGYKIRIERTRSHMVGFETSAGKK